MIAYNHLSSVALAPFSCYCYIILFWFSGVNGSQTLGVSILSDFNFGGEMRGSQWYAQNIEGNTSPTSPTAPPLTPMFCLHSSITQRSDSVSEKNYFDPALRSTVGLRKQNGEWKGWFVRCKIVLINDLLPWLDCCSQDVESFSSCFHYQL